MSTANPYAPVVSHTSPAIGGELKYASQNQRFLAWILDNLVIFGINYAFGIVVGILLVTSGVLTPETANGIQIILMLVGWVLAFMYYSALEVMTGMTLGKMVMGTKVLTKEGGKPSVGQFLGRSACRFIPFEPFSFLIGTNSRFPIGWHDRIPGTVVVSTRR